MSCCCQKGHLGLGCVSTSDSAPHGLPHPPPKRACWMLSMVLNQFRLQFQDPLFDLGLFGSQVISRCLALCFLLGVRTPAERVMNLEDTELSGVKLFTCFLCEQLVCHSSVLYLKMKWTMALLFIPAWEKIYFFFCDFHSDRLCALDANSDGFRRPPGSFERFPPQSHAGLFQLQMQAAFVRARRSLLREPERNGRQQRLRHHRRRHPKTFRGADHAAALRHGLLLSEGALLQIQAAPSAAERTSACHHVPGAAHGELRLGQLGLPGSSSVAYIWRVQTAHLWGDCSGRKPGASRVLCGTSYMRTSTMVW